MKGILFKPDMIKAIVEGRKTVTRRLPDYPKYGNYKSQESDWDIHLVDGGLFITTKDGIIFNTECGMPSRGMQDHILKPRYLPGETIYIKEAFTYAADVFAITPCVVYKSDNASRVLKSLPDGTTVYNMNEHPECVKWHSPLFMPEFAARYFIKIKDVRPERLQEITDEDCYKEGISEEAVQEADHYNIGGSPLQGGSPERCAYAGLWDSINKKTPWASNPWVWRIEFERVEMKP